MTDAPKKQRPGCFRQTVGRPIDPADLAHVRSQGSEALCEFYLASNLGKQSRSQLVRLFFPMSFREFLALERRVLASVGETHTIHVPLLGEGPAVWRPVRGTRVAPGVFRLGGPVPEGESWAFGAGERVQCAMRAFADGVQGLVAFQRADAEPGTAPDRAL